MCVEETHFQETQRRLCGSHASGSMSRVEKFAWICQIIQCHSSGKQLPNLSKRCDAMRGSRGDGKLILTFVGMLYGCDRLEL